MKKITLTLARILFAVPFLVSGFGHFANANAMAAMVPSYVPGGVLWVYVTGLILFASAITFVTGKYMKYGGIAVAVTLVVFILTIHIPNLSNPQMAQMALGNMMKDIALIGGALFLAVREPQPQLHEVLS